MTDLAGNSGTGLLLVDSSLSSVATVSSTGYTVDNTLSTITNVPYGTSRTTVLSILTKDESHQTWNTGSLDTPVVS